ncbi:radical SAM/SPASM domain-containing protein [Planctomycetota bacterium]
MKKGLYARARKRIRGTLLRLRHRNFLTLIKLAEVRLLGRYASTYCYNSPSHVLIETTSKCNLRCVWCQQADPQWRKRNWAEMKVEDAKRILPDLKGAKVLLLYNIGEPLLYKGLCELIAEARSHIPNVWITTNATLLTEKKARELGAAGLTQLNVSIDSPDPEIFRRVRGTDLERITANLETFCSVTRIPLHFWTVISTATAESLKRLPEYASRFANTERLEFQLVNGFELTEKAGISMALTERSYEEFREVVLDKCERYGYRSNLEYLSYYPPGFFDRKADHRCGMLMTSLVSINTKGYLNPCCTYRELELDSVLELGFRRAWNGPRVRAWRRRMLNQDYGRYCQNWCGYQNKGGNTDLDDEAFK